LSIAISLLINKFKDFKLGCFFLTKHLHNEVGHREHDYQNDPRKHEDQNYFIELEHPINFQKL